MSFPYDLTNSNNVAFSVICVQSIAINPIFLNVDDCTLIMCVFLVKENWFIAIYFPKRVDHKSIVIHLYYYGICNKICFTCEGSFLNCYLYEQVLTCIFS